MIYQRNFIKELSLTAASIFTVLLAVLVSTQATNLFGRAADGRVVIDAVLASVGSWVIGIIPLLLMLIALISALIVSIRYWRDSEMSVWLSCGLALKQWICSVMQSAVSFAILTIVMQFWVMPWIELRSREYAEIPKQKQELSLVEASEFNSLGKCNGRVYFVEIFDAESDIMKNLSLREQDKNSNDNIVFAKEGNFSPTDNKCTLELRDGYRYSGTFGKTDYNCVSFRRLSLIISTTPKLVDPISHRRIIPITQLTGSSNSQHQTELVWRISLTVSVLLLCLFAMPLFYFNPCGDHTYNTLTTIGSFLVYQSGLAFLRNAVEDGKVHSWLGLLPMHTTALVIVVVLLRVRSMPSQPFWQAVTKSLTLKGGK